MAVSMKISSVAAALLTSIQELEFGELSPDELVFGPDRVEAQLSSQEVKLLYAIDVYGTPLLIKVADKRPLYAEFEIKTRVGPGRKRINLN